MKHKYLHILLIGTEYIVGDMKHKYLHILLIGTEYIVGDMKHKYLLIHRIYLINIYTYY